MSQHELRMTHNCMERSHADISLCLNPDRKICVTKLLGCSCHAQYLERIPRSFWMRFIPLIRLYYCANCNSRVLASKRRVDAGRLRNVSVTYIQSQAGVQKVANSPPSEPSQQGSARSSATTPKDAIEDTR